jgi:hypothetical protein
MVLWQVWSWYAERDHLAYFKRNIYRGTSIGHRKPDGQLLIYAQIELSEEIIYMPGYPTRELV